MQDILIPLLISSIAGASTLFGAIPIFIKIKDENLNKFICFCLTLSFTVMIGVSLFDLLPTGFNTFANSFPFYKALIILIILFILTFIIINILSCMLNKKNNGEELYKLGILNMLVLVSHNIPEGFITFLSSYYDTSLGLKIALTIFIHNVTEGISIAVPIYYGTNSRKKALFVTLIASLSEPLGGLLSLILFKNYISDILISIILIGVATLMINLSIIKIYPEINKYKTKLSIILGTIIGSLFIILSMQ